jgi:ligand-binding SRPBCC domain-containing protein
VLYRLQRRQFIPGSPTAIWDFFATPRNLDRLTSPQLRFRIVGDVAPRMYAGQLIEYRVGIVPGIETRWLTEITHVREGEYFVDEQRCGPYRLWHHQHRFSPVAGGVEMTDLVTYDPGWGWLGGLGHAVWIGGKLRTIFALRAEKVREAFPGAGAAEIL